MSILTKTYDAFCDLFRDAKTGGVSQSKFWTNIAYGAATWKFLSGGCDSTEIWMIYLGIVGAHSVVNKWISTNKKPEPPKTGE